jgi:hypothetical protein
MRMMLLGRLRKGVITEEDFVFISERMQDLIFKTRNHLEQVIELSPRSVRRIFNGEQPTFPQQRIEIFNRYLRAIEAELSHARFTHQHRPRPRR